VTDHEAPVTIDALLDRAFEAIGAGDRQAANVLAERVLAVDSGNVDAEDLLAAPVGDGEIRRLTILFADLVDSTELSTRIEPEIYRTVVGRYREYVLQIVDRYEGHIASTKGDGLLAVFGHPRAHENDIRRAVQAGLDISREVAKLAERVRKRFGFDIDVRVGVHRGLVYLDVTQDDVYGLAANLAARVSGLAQPGTVVVSGAIEPLVSRDFELEVRPPQPVKGIAAPVEHYRVVAERATGARIPRGPLVGRQCELAYLKRAWAQAQAGALATPGVAFVGEPGIGKSRMATEAADLAEHSGGVVLPLIGSPFLANAGLHPVRALLERRCGIVRLTDPAERLQLLRVELAKVAMDPVFAIPLLAPVLGIGADHGYEPVRADGTKLYDKIAQGVLEYLLACVGDSAAVVLVEDMHWFDPSTIDVVEALLNTGVGRLLVVMTGRSGAKMPSDERVEVLELETLTDAETDELIAALDPGLAVGQRRVLSTRCDGVPLYIEEVVAGLTENSEAPLHPNTVPDALYEPLFARLRAHANVVPVVEAAAAIGRDVDRSLLVSVLDMNEDELDMVIGQLEDALVFERLPGDSWRFRHELLREVASELSPPSVRRSLHGRVADALVTSADPDWGLVAVHYDEAARFKEAAKAYGAAAEDARRRGALAEARTCLDRALAQIERLPPHPSRDRREITVRLRRGFLASAAEGTSGPNTVADFERCLQLSGTDRSDQLLMTLTALYGYYARRADLSRVEQLLEALRADGRDFLMPENEAGFGMVSWYRGEFDTARAKLESVAAVRSDVDVPEFGSVWFIPNEPIASIHTHLAMARAAQGDLAGADAALAKSRRRCALLGFPQGAVSLCYARQMEVLIRCEAGQLDRAAAVVAEMATAAEQHGFTAWTEVSAAQQIMVAALAELATGSADAAALVAHAEALAEYADLWRAQEAKYLLPSYDGVIARLLTAAGQNDQAKARLHAGLTLGVETGMHYYDAELLRIRAGTHSTDEQRRADLAAAAQLARRQSATIFELRCAMDGFESAGEPSRGALVDAIGRFSADAGWPELERAQALLG
jgi:class 3 adenylate cyclase/tetratricopeptide (TPR) repeat protein